MSCCSRLTVRTYTVLTGPSRHMLITLRQLWGCPDQVPQDARCRHCRKAQQTTEVGVLVQRVFAWYDRILGIRGSCELVPYSYSALGSGGYKISSLRILVV